MSQYQKDGLRPLTKVFRKESGDWIVWNWDTARLCPRTPICPKSRGFAQKPASVVLSIFCVLWMLSSWAFPGVPKFDFDFVEFINLWNGGYLNDFGKGEVGPQLTNFSFAESRFIRRCEFLNFEATCDDEAKSPWNTNEPKSQHAITIGETPNSERRTNCAEPDSNQPADGTHFYSSSEMLVSGIRFLFIGLGLGGFFGFVLATKFARQPR